MHNHTFLLTEFPDGIPVIYYNAVDAGNKVSQTDVESRLFLAIITKTH